MLLKTRYDPKEDRIQLSLYPGEGARRAFWLTRRQCVALLQVIRQTLKTSPSAGPKAATLRAQGKDLGAAPASPKLAQLRWRRLAGGLSLVFIGDEGERMRLNLGAAELSILQKTLLQLARRAQWEVEATLQRLAERPTNPPVVH